MRLRRRKGACIRIRRMRALQDRFNKAAAELRSSAVEELKTKKAVERGTKRSSSGLADGWTHIRGDGDRIKVRKGGKPP